MNTIDMSRIDKKDEAMCQLLLFVSNYAKLLKAHVSEAQSLMACTVEHVMAGVTNINEVAEFKSMKADEILIQENQQGFVSKKAQEVDSKLKVNVTAEGINRRISEHMAKFTNLDDNVRSLLFSIMGALSMDDVVRQRLEHVTSAIHNVDDVVKKLVEEFSKGTLKEEFVQQLCQDIARKMYKSFTMEEEKKVFKSVFGSAFVS